jgi:hypothetical protein
VLLHLRRKILQPSLDPVTTKQCSVELIMLQRNTERNNSSTQIKLKALKGKINRSSPMSMYKNENIGFLTGKCTYGNMRCCAAFHHHNKYLR